MLLKQECPDMKCKKYHLEYFGGETRKSKTRSTDTKWDVSHYACSSKWKTSVWTITLFPWDSAWNANAQQRQCQSARAESWQREVGCGSCDALLSHSNRSREWQAGVSSLTWVQQREGKTLHLAVEPWREEGREEEAWDEMVCVCVFVFFRWVLCMHESPFACDAAYSVK